MNEERRTLPGMHVLGVSCQTGHETAFEEIGALWARAAAAGLLASSPEAWAVYHDYAPSNGGYRVTVTVGRAADATTPVTDGLALVAVPSQSCVVLPTDGSIASVQDAWARVWATWPDGGPRTFVADVERWRTGPDGLPVGAEIFVGVR